MRYYYKGELRRICVLFTFGLVLSWKSVKTTTRLLLLMDCHSHGRIWMFSVETFGLICVILYRNLHACRREKWAVVKSSMVKSPLLRDGLLAVLQLLHWLNSNDVAGCLDKSIYLHEDNVSIESDKFEQKYKVQYSSFSVTIRHLLLFRINYQTLCG